MTHSERTYAWKQANKAAGNCWTCTNPAVPGKASCETHLEKNRQREELRRRRGIAAAYQRARRAQMVAEGKCCRCHLPAEPGRRMCARHLERNKMDSRATYERARMEAQTVCPKGHEMTPENIDMEEDSYGAPRRRCRTCRIERRRVFRQSRAEADSPEDIREIKAAASIPICRCGLRLLRPDEVAQGRCNGCVPDSAVAFAQQRRTHWSDGVVVEKYRELGRKR